MSIQNTAISFNSDAASGWAGWALAHPEFGSLFNPIKSRGADYAHHITASPPGFENPAASLFKAIHFFNKIKLILYPQVRNSISHLPLVKIVALYELAGV